MDSTTRDGIEPEPEDLTGRARIRHAALIEFGAHGFERATVRGIAARAGVSPGLVRHHFGSKEALRRECDDYLARTVRRLNDRVRGGGQGDMEYVAATRGALYPYQAYLARTLADGSAAPLFDLMVGMTAQWLDQADRGRDDPPLADPRDRAAVWTAMTLAIPILHQQLSRCLGVDVFGPDGERRVGLALLDIYSHPIVTPEYAERARAAIERVHNDRQPDPTAGPRENNDHHADREAGPRGSRERTDD